MVVLLCLKGLMMMFYSQFLGSVTKLLSVDLTVTLKDWLYPLDLLIVTSTGFTPISSLIYSARFCSDTPFEIPPMKKLASRVAGGTRWPAMPCPDGCF